MWEILQMIISDIHKKRFFDNITKIDSCWIYKKNIQESDYRRIYINGKSIGAHRVSYLIHHGSIPEKMFICHKCDNPLCVNPQHLFAGTPKDNSDDMAKKGRGSLRKGIHYPKPKLTEDNVKDIFRLSGQLSQRELATKFNVTQGLIEKILNKKAWKKVSKTLTSMSSIGQGSNQKGIRSPRVKLTENQVLSIFKMKGSKTSIQVAKEFNITSSSIRHIWNGHTWSHLTNKFRSSKC